MTLREDIKQDFIDEFLDTDEFAEAIVYTTKCGIEKSIKAIINRVPTDSGDEDHGRVMRRTAEIKISNDATAGMTEIDTKGDKVSFPLYPGGSTNIDWAVISIMEPGIGSWKLMVTR